MKATACGPCRSATRRIAPPVRSRASSQPIGSQPGSGGDKLDIAACRCAGVSEASQALENGISDIRNLDLDLAVVFALRLEEAEVADGHPRRARRFGRASGSKNRGRGRPGGSSAYNGVA